MIMVFIMWSTMWHGFRLGFQSPVERLPSLRHSFLHASFFPTCLRRTTGGTSSLLVRSVLSFPSTGLLSMHKRAQCIRLTLVVNTNASTTYSPWRVVNMTNGYSKYSDTAIFKIPNVQVNPVRMKIFKNTTAFLRCIVWWVALCVCLVVFLIALTVNTKNITLNDMQRVTGTTKKNIMAVELFIQHPLLPS